jgi:hypothetical protein
VGLGRLVDRQDHDVLPDRDVALVAEAGVLADLAQAPLGIGDVHDPEAAGRRGVRAGALVEVAEQQAVAPERHVGAVAVLALVVEVRDEPHVRGLGPRRVLRRNGRDRDQRRRSADGPHEH